MSRGRSSKVAGGALELTLRRQELSRDDGGHACWREIVEPAAYACAQTALLLCDVWDRHWSRGATERVDAMVPRMNEVATAARDMGVLIEGPHHGQVIVHGVGLHGLKAPGKPLYMGNSGTSMRLLTGLLAGQAFDVELTGDASLSKRPMERVARPLRDMGAQITTGNEGRPPVRIRGGQPLKGIHYDLPMASAQVKSAVLLMKAPSFTIRSTRSSEPSAAFIWAIRLRPQTRAAATP